MNQLPSITVHTFCWNEEKLIPHTMDYWSKIARKIIVHDNGSTDRSIELLQKYPKVEIRTFDTRGSINDRILLDLKNGCWKEQRASGTDWVVVADMDELIYSENLIPKLHALKKKKYTVVLPIGVNMVCETFPEYKPGVPIMEQCTTGVPDKKFAKCIIFSPDDIEEINYNPGGHLCAPTGKVKFHVSPDIFLLHYKNLGADYLIDRYAKAAGRLSEFNLKNGYGAEYLNRQRQIRETFERQLAQAHNFHRFARKLSVSQRLGQWLALRWFYLRYCGRPKKSSRLLKFTSYR